MHACMDKKKAKSTSSGSHWSPVSVLISTSSRVLGQEDDRMDVASISAVVAAGGVIIGVVFAVLQLRDLVKTRQTDLIVRLYSTFDSKEFLEAFEKVMAMEFKDFDEALKKYGMSLPLHVGLFFEQIGVLLHRKLIDIELVDDLFTSPIKQTWEKMEPLEKAARKYYNRPQIGEWFEYLYNEMQKRDQTLQAQP